MLRVGELRKKRILVVEDDPVGQFVVVDALTAHGYDVSLARTGPEGIAMAHATQPDLILCDVLLPQKSGFEVCFEVKRSARTRDVPVVFMSAVCRDSYAEAYAAIDLRAEAYFVKPFRMGALVSRIRGLLTT
jgi:DNA-binding response OmpR family regulator